ncbi:MAG: peptidoglycan-binding domain-containing protein [Bacteroidota bacterium]
MEKDKKEKPKKSNAKKIALIGIGIAALGTGGYFGWQYLQSQKNKKKSLDEDEDKVPYTPVEITPVTQTSYTPSVSSSSSSQKAKSDFPLKKGSKGKWVKRYQDKLISKYGKSILPRYGADGDFGSEMEAALVKLKLPTEISASAYNLFVIGVAPDASALASSLIEAAENKDYSSAISSLKKIRNVKDYTAISDEFKEMRINGGVRKTLVTGMLDTFDSSSQQNAIRQEFLRIGLKYDGSKWSLSGLDGAPTIITLHPTVIWDYPNTRIRVEGNVVLGYPIETKKGFTLFQTMDGKRRLIVKEKSVRIIQNN